jgi:hypothetical protein
MGIKLIKKNEKVDGFFHVCELQAQQAKETLEELTKKFGDANRLEFSIHNYPHRQECDAYVTVDGNPFITAEFEGGRHGSIRWHCFEDDVTDMHLDASDEDAAEEFLSSLADDILDALTSLYEFGAIADEGNQLQESKEGTVKQEANWNTLWRVEFCDMYRNVKKEYYDTEAEAKARYDELAERGDIEWVEDPVKIETVGVSYAKYAESVKAILMGREFEYGPETANEFVEDDYKDIVRKNYDAFESPFKAAADIDDVYMRKE